MSDASVVIREASEVPWTDTETVFGTRGDPGRCFCQYFKMIGAEWAAGNREKCAADLRSQVETDPVSPGLVAYLDGIPAGWVAVEPRPRYPQVFRGKVVPVASREAPEDDSVWAIVCFVVRVGYRRRGLAQQLLRAAVDHAWRNGARVIEGYPVDTVEKPKASSAELYHGTVGLFESAGFTVDARPMPGRALVTLTANS